MKILLALGHCDASQTAVNFLLNQAVPRRTEVRILHVADPYPEKLAQQMGTDEFPNFVSARRKQLQLAEQLLEHAAEQLSSAGFAVTCSIQEGDVSEIIIEEAKRWHADLIVVGWRKRKGIWRFFLENISEDLSRNAPCSVMIVRNPLQAEEPRHLCTEEDVRCSSAA